MPVPLVGAVSVPFQISVDALASKNRLVPNEESKIVIVNIQQIIRLTLFLNSIFI